jgi:hypothetical protein
MSVTYFTGSGQSAFTVAVTVGLPVWEDAIPELGGKLMFRQDHMIRAVSFERLALSTTYTAHGSYGVPTSSSYFLVEENGFSGERGGLLKWSRVWATVPTTWTNDETFAFTYPAYVAATTIGSPFGITGITDSTTLYRIATTATGIIANDQIFVNVTYARASFAYNVNAFFKVLAASSGSSVDIPHSLPGSGAFSAVDGTLAESSSGRNAEEAIVVGSRVQHDYALIPAPEVAGNLDLYLPSVQAFRPVDPYGNRAAILLTGTATRPSSDRYQTMVNTGVMLVAEDSMRERWAGNIYVRKTRLVPAQ